MTFVSTYLINNKRARLWAILWTLLILFLCFLPGNELPEVDLPFIDKWTHLILFGVFALLWLLSIGTKNIKYIAAILVVSCYIGWLVEYIQGYYIPNRSRDTIDIVADVCGAVTGIVVFLVLYKPRPVQ